MQFKVDDEWKRWIRSEKELLYQIGYAYLQTEEEIETALVMVVKTFKKEELFRQTLKQQFIERFVKRCKSQKYRKTCVQRIFETTENPLVRLRGLKREVLYYIYVLKFSYQEIEQYLNIDRETIIKNHVTGVKGLVSEPESGQTYSVEKLLNYHLGLLPLSDYKKTANEIVNDVKFQAEYERVVMVIEQIKKLKHVIKPSRHFFMDNKPLTESQKKKRKTLQTIATVSVSIMVVLLVCILMMDFTAIHTWWIKVSAEHTYGVPVYKSDTHEDIKVTITHVAADDYQTILYYEIENMNEESSDFFYYINNFDTKDRGIWLNSHYYHYSEPLLYNENRNTGRMFLPPIRNEEEEINVRVYTVGKDSKEEAGFMYYSEAHHSIGGYWEITVPIVKQESKVYVIDETIDIDGRTYHFSELEVSPTGTFLSYDTDLFFASSDGTYEYDHLQFGPLLVHDKEFLPTYYHREKHSSALEISFESIYYEDIEEIALTLNYLVRQVDLYDNAAHLYRLNINELPTTVTYLDSKIIIEDRSNETEQVLGIVTEDYHDRPFDYLDVHITPLLERPDEHLYANTFPKTIWIDNDGIVLDEEELFSNHWNYHWNYSMYRSISLDYTVQFESFEQSTHNIEVENFDFMIHGHMRTIPINEVIKISIK